MLLFSAVYPPCTNPARLPELQKFCLSSLRIASQEHRASGTASKTVLSVNRSALIGLRLDRSFAVTHCNPVDKSLRTVNMGSIGLPLPGTESESLIRNWY